MNSADKPPTQMTQPLVIDLGRQRAKKLKQFKQGEGELWDELQAVIEKVHAELGASADGKVLVPVVMIYERKSKRSGLDQLIFPRI
jgi:hypothetical protein